MKAIANPFAPGAGAPPPEIAGRDPILKDAILAIQRNRGGKSVRSFIYIGLRAALLKLDRQKGVSEKVKPE